jgi:hypothetical protein
MHPAGTGGAAANAGEAPTTHEAVGTPSVTSTGARPHCGGSALVPLHRDTEPGSRREARVRLSDQPHVPRSQHPRATCGLVAVVRVPVHRGVGQTAPNAPEMGLGHHGAFEPNPNLRLGSEGRAKSVQYASHRIPIDRPCNALTRNGGLLAGVGEGQSSTGGRRLPV